MSRLKLIKFREMNALLLRLGFEVVRKKGSHVFYRHANGRTTTVPNHGNKDLSRKLIRKILQDIELIPQQYQEELEKS